MARLLLLIVLCLCFAKVEAGATYTILAEDAAGLWGQADGTGAGNDIVRAAFAAVGDRAVLEVVPYNRCKQRVMAGHAVACFGMSWSAEFKDRVVFAKSPLYATTTTLFIRKADEAKYRKVTDIPRGTRVGTVLGYEYPPQFEQLVQSQILVPDTANSEVQSLRKLAAGRFDLAALNLDELKNADYMLGQAGVNSMLQVAFTLETSGTYLGFSVRHPQMEAAKQAYDQGMTIIQSNGTLAKILLHWKTKH